MEMTRHKTILNLKQSEKSAKKRCEFPNRFSTFFLERYELNLIKFFTLKNVLFITKTKN